MPSYDPEFLAAVQPLIAARGNAPRPAVHDIATRRSNLDKFFSPLFAAIQRPADVTETIYTTAAADGHVLNIHHFFKAGGTATPGPAVYYTHGGGYIAMSVRDLSNSVAVMCGATGAQFFGIEYRLAPEFPFPTPLEDCYTGLQWLYSQTEKFGVDPMRIGVLGDSAGGGLAAALCIAARDRGLTPPIKKQVLIYPMLDNTNVLKNEMIADKVVWSAEDSITGWAAYLGCGKDQDPAEVDAPVLAAPAKVADVKGLPPLYLEVGTLDIFREEDIKYAMRFMEAGINVELHLYDGLPHAFGTMAPKIAATQRAVANKIAALKSI